mgnify:CR=1 FL=1
MSLPKPSPELSRRFAAAKFIWIRSVASDPSVGGLACRVAAILLDFFQVTDATAWPSQQLLARHAGVTPRALRDAIRRLEVAGYLTVTRPGRNRVNRYRLTLPTEPSTGAGRRAFGRKNGARNATQNFPRILEQNPSPLAPQAPITPEVREAIRDGMNDLIGKLGGRQADRAKGEGNV